MADNIIMPSRLANDFVEVGVLDVTFTVGKFTASGDVVIVFPSTVRLTGPRTVDVVEGVVDVVVDGVEVVVVVGDVDVEEVVVVVEVVGALVPVVPLVVFYDVRLGVVVVVVVVVGSADTRVPD